MPAIEIVTLLSGAKVPAIAAERTMTRLRVWEACPNGGDILLAVHGMANGLEPEMDDQMLDAIGAGGGCSARGVLHPSVVLIVQEALVLAEGVMTIVDPLEPA